jgi:hypothetical protein
MDTIRLAGTGNVVVELRGTVSGETVTLEHRTWIAGGTIAAEWEPLTIGALVELLSSRNGIFPWLERTGVLWGAWLGRGAHEVASFTAVAPMTARRPRKVPAFRVRSSRLAKTA